MGNCSAGADGPIGEEWDVSRVTDMERIFYQANSFNADVSKWDVSRVTNMGYMFEEASSFNMDLSKWDVSRVTNMVMMFAHANSFNMDLSKWDVSRASSVYNMFMHASSFQQTLCGKAWVNSNAFKRRIFYGSPGKISTTVCGLCVPLTLF